MKVLTINFTQKYINQILLNELILNVKSKRYTYSRLSRILCKFFIGFESYDVETIKILVIMLEF